MPINQIPKIIHFCWFGNKRYPPVVQKCIDSWAVHLPDWKIILWNEANSPINSEHPYLLKAIDQKQYAFAADYTRCYALHKYGGVYFDTDVEVIKDFSPLTKLSGFLAPENCTGDLYNVAVFGIQKNHIFCHDMMSYYNSLHEFEPIPDVVSTLLKKGSYDISILDRKSFYPYNP
ncbi:glycosyltransferase family 32 protein, partial [Klebsiella quasipneumoniae subsp. similipneumoniae]|uniref:glycosyltransferase family 32 protein n=1 Tax=Klebsiella quasipneumoniae TaxID=1463165 RepID=UPI003BF6EA68